MAWIRTVRVKQTIFFGSFFLASQLFVMLVASSTASAEVLRARADSWCPYNCEPSSETPGVLIELLQESFKGTGYAIDYSILPWSQAVAEVRTGKYDAIIAAAKEDLAGMIHTDKPQVIQKSCAYGLSSYKRTVTKANDLKKFKKLGSVKDYSYGDITNKVLSSPAMQMVLSSIGGDDPVGTNLRRTLDGKIDAFLENEDVVTYYLKEHKIDNIKKLGCTEDSLALWIGFPASNPKSKAWVSTLDAGQAVLEKSGKMAVIYKKYGITHD